MRGNPASSSIPFCPPMPLPLPAGNPASPLTCVPIHLAFSTLTPPSNRVPPHPRIHQTLGAAIWIMEIPFHTCESPTCLGIDRLLCIVRRSKYPTSCHGAFNLTPLLREPPSVARFLSHGDVFYWAAQMVGSADIGYFLDFGLSSRRKRGLIGVVAVAVLGTAIWAGGLANQLTYLDGAFPDKIDFKDGHRYAGPFLLYFCYGLLDAMFQSLIYWIIGALANDSQILSRYVGFYKGVQSAGAAVAWQVDTHKTSLLSQLIVNWGLTTISYPLLAVLVFLAVKDEDYSVSSVEDGKEKDTKMAAPSSLH